MNYNSKSLLDVKFSKNVKGYDALEVDETLDEVIEDYIHYEKKSSNDEQTIRQLKEEIVRLKEELRKGEIEKTKYKNIVDSIPDNPNVNRQNLAYIQRIRVLENALYKKGVDPKKL